MIKAYFANVRKSNSLTAKIRDAEQQIIIRQRGVGVRTGALIKKIHRQMTAPSTLLMTVGIGFILGELTKRQTASHPGLAGKQRISGTSPLMSALSLITSAHTLYKALPIAWKTRIFNPSAKPGGHQAHEQQAQQVSAAGNSRRSRQ